MFSKTSTRSARTSRVLAAAAVAVAFAGIAPAAHAGGGGHAEPSEDYLVEADWVVRGATPGFDGNAYRIYLDGWTGTTDAGTAAMVTGYMENFSCPKGVTPPRDYVWSEPTPKTRCTFLGASDLVIDSSALTLSTDLSKASINGEAQLYRADLAGEPGGEYIATLPINATISGRGKVKTSISSFTNEYGETLTSVSSTRSARVTGSLGGQRGTSFHGDLFRDIRTVS